MPHDRADRHPRPPARKADRVVSARHWRVTRPHQPGRSTCPSRNRQRHGGRADREGGARCHCARGGCRASDRHRQDPGLEHACSHHAMPLRHRCARWCADYCLRRHGPPLSARGHRHVGRFGPGGRPRGGSGRRRHSRLHAVRLYRPRRGATGAGRRTGACAGRHQPDDSGRGHVVVAGSAIARPEHVTDGSSTPSADRS